MISGAQRPGIALLRRAADLLTEYVDYKALVECEIQAYRKGARGWPAEDR